MILPSRAVAPGLVPLAAGTRLHRIHHVDYPGARLNPCRGAGTRFAPLWEAGVCIPTFYAATTFDGAAYEAVFRGRPHPFKLAPYQEVALRGASEISPRRDLALVPLFGPELLGWGLDPLEVFSPDTAVYTSTRDLALRAWRDNPSAQGLVWTSVRDNSAWAVLLFGDRVAETDFDLVRHREVRSDPDLLNDLRNAGLRAGFRIAR